MQFYQSFCNIISGLFSFCSYGCFGNKYEEMPDLKGKTEKQAEKVLDSHHLKVGDISRNYSDKYPENQIIKQIQIVENASNKGIELISFYPKDQRRLRCQMF